MKNDRPILNLSFIYKLIKSVVTRRIIEHLGHNDLYDIYQSAYNRNWSFESAQ